jgi:hypothetical protein
MEAASYEEKMTWADIFRSHISYASAKRAYNNNAARPHGEVYVPPSPAFKFYAPEPEEDAGGGNGSRGKDGNEDAAAAKAEGGDHDDVSSASSRPAAFVPFALQVSRVYAGPVPETISGYLNKQNGLLINWHDRYFVAELGVLRFYISKAPGPPFGNTERGALALTGYSVVRVPGNNCRLRLVAPVDDEQPQCMFRSTKDILVEATDKAKRDVWVAVLEEHIKFADEHDVAPATSAGPKPPGARFG